MALEAENWRTSTRRRHTASTPAWLLRLAELDLILVAATLVMSAVGALMVYSATRFALISQGLSPRHELERDALFLVLGAAVMFVLAFVDYHRWEAMWAIILGGTIFLLLVVMLPHIGKQALGSTRWIPVGPFQFQPSAFADIAVMISVAALLSGATLPISWKRLGVIVAVVGVTMALVAKQPDLGSAIVIGIVVSAMLVVGGIRARQLVLLVVIAGVAVSAVLNLHLLHGYQAARLTSFLHQNQHKSGANYNLTQAKIEIGSGGIFGKGIFHDQLTNRQYVPEQQTDFIFTAVGGQMGFLGTSAVLLLYGLIASRLWMVARSASDSAGMLMASGAFALLTFSVFENAGMTMGITPITGIPLPFMSYGGSADVVFFAAVGISLNIARQARGRTRASPLLAMRSFARRVS